MRETIVVVGIDADGRVLAIRHLAPGRLAVLSGAFWVLELPGDEAGPGIGSRLAIIAPT
jgi:hypothetical protein